MGNDTTLTIVPFSEIEAKVDGTTEVREITKSLQRLVRSVSRSDRFAAELIVRKTDFSFLAEKLHEFLNASHIVPRQIYNEETGQYESKDFEIPDWKTRMRAWENAVKVFGLEFMLPKDPTMNINVNTLAIARDVESMSIDELKREAQAAMSRMKDIDPSVFDVDDAEVVE